MGKARSLPSLIATGDCCLLGRRSPVFSSGGQMEGSFTGNRGETLHFSRIQCILLLYSATGCRCPFVFGKDGIEYEQKSSGDHGERTATSPRWPRPIKRLKSFGIPVEVRVMSAHRTPEAAAEFSKTARENGFGVIIAAAGKAAHLAGVLAAHTTLPGDRHPGEVLHLGRLGRIACHGADALRHPRCHRGHRWRGQRSDPGLPDAGPLR